jgi:hypothetical protein
MRLTAFALFFVLVVVTITEVDSDIRKARISSNEAMDSKHYLFPLQTFRSYKLELFGGKVPFVYPKKVERVQNVQGSFIKMQINPIKNT